MTSSFFMGIQDHTTGSREDEVRSMQPDVEARTPVTLPTEDVLRLTHVNSSQRLSLSSMDGGGNESSTSVHPRASLLQLESGEIATTPTVTSSPRSSPKQAKSRSKSNTSLNKKLKIAAKREKKSMDAVVAAAIRNYAGDNGDGERKHKVDGTHHFVRTQCSRKSPEGGSDGTPVISVTFPEAIVKEKKMKTKGEKTKPKCQKEEGIENEDGIIEEKRKLRLSTTTSKSSEQLSGTQEPALTPSTSRSIDRAGAVAVFPSDSEHTTRRRSLKNHRRISDFDGFEGNEAELVDELYDESLEMIPEPPRSQTISADVTSSTTSSHSPSHGSSTIAPPPSLSGTSRNSASLSIGRNGRGSSSLTAPNSSFSHGDESIFGSTHETSNGTVTARAISSDDYYAEVKRRIQEEAIVAVDIVTIKEEEEKTSSIAFSLNDRRKRLLLLGATLTALLILTVILALTIDTKPDDDDEYSISTDEYSQSPTELMNSGMGRYFQLIVAELLPKDSLTKIVGNYESPQFKAFSFLVENEKFLFNITDMNVFLTDKENSELITLFALVTMFYSLDGPNWYIKTNWLNPEKTFCEWHGIECKGERLAKDIPPDDSQPRSSGGSRFVRNLRSADDSRRRQLLFVDDAFEDEINASFGQNDTTENPTSVLYNESVEDRNDATYTNENVIDEANEDNIPIISLKLNANNLVGQLPNELGLLTNVYDLIDLHFNKISGSIPSNLQQLSSLQAVVLRDNVLSSTIPSELGFMTSMEIFDISGNTALSGSLPKELGQWTEIQKMEIQGTSLTGEVPAEVCDLMENQTEFSPTFIASCSEIFPCSCCTECCTGENNEKVCTPVAKR